MYESVDLKGLMKHMDRPLMVFACLYIFMLFPFVIFFEEGKSLNKKTFKLEISPNRRTGGIWNY